MESFENHELEEMLKLAVKEPAHRPQFFDVLMNSQVFILGTTGRSEPSNHEEDGAVRLEAGEQLQIQHWEKSDGTPIIPFFSSLEVLQQSIDAHQSYLALPARSLFEMTLGATLFLNPKSHYSKEFVPHEVENLLAHGSGAAPASRII